ncbi:hypothetical protein TA3x_000688 [Tundrisphaera sp. TA3]|uniref:hypothetical protein n=1 Tax=Tundrisphaera sp. TA3 TaxID=3435775 RepID=UPI003EBBACCB
MSFAPPDEINPFEAPRAGIKPGSAGPVVDADAEAARRKYLGHEASIAAIGLLCYLVAFAMGRAVLATVLLLIELSDRLKDNGERLAFFLVIGFIWLALAAFFAAVGNGLGRFKTWARWAAVALAACWMLGLLWAGAYLFLSMQETATSALFIVAGLLLVTFILRLLLCFGSGVVFSPPYRDIIGRTPHLRPRIRPVVKIALGLLLGGIILGYLKTIRSASL